MSEMIGSRMKELNNVTFDEMVAFRESLLTDRYYVGPVESTDPEMPEGLNRKQRRAWLSQQRKAK